MESKSLPPLRYKVENLLKFLLPFLMLRTIWAVLAATYLKNICGSDSIQSEFIVANGTYILLARSAIDVMFNLIAACWLYIQAKEYALNKFLWPLYALIQPLVTLPVFIFIILYEEIINIKLNYNKSFERDA